MPNHNINTVKRRRIRQRLFLAQDGKCAYCGAPMTIDKVDCMSPRYATIDHVRPVVEFRTRRRAHRGNVVLACRACNDWKGTLSAEEFRRIVDRRKGETR